MTDDSLVRKRFKRAVFLRDRGRYREVADLMSELLDSDLSRRDRAAVTGFLAGVVLYNLDEPGNAEPLCRSSVSLSPRSELASLGLFHVLWDLHRPLDALLEMKRYVGLSGEFKEYEQLILDLADSMANPAKASDGLKAFVAGSPEPEWRMVLDEIRAAFD